MAETDQEVTSKLRPLTRALVFLRKINKGYNENPPTKGKTMNTRNLIDAMESIIYEDRFHQEQILQLKSELSLETKSPQKTAIFESVEMHAFEMGRLYEQRAKLLKTADKRDRRFIWLQPWKKPSKK